MYKLLTPFIREYWRDWDISIIRLPNEYELIRGMNEKTQTYTDYYDVLRYIAQMVNESELN